MTETEKMEKHITSLRRLGEVLHKSIGSEYHAISLQLGGGFPGWMPHPERPAFLTTWPGLPHRIQPVFAPGRYATSPGRDCSPLCEKRFCFSSRRNSRSVHGNGFAVKSEASGGIRKQPHLTARLPLLNTDRSSQPQGTAYSFLCCEAQVLTEIVATGLGLSTVS